MKTMSLHGSSQEECDCAFTPRRTQVPFADSSIGRRGQADGVRVWRGAAFTLILPPIMRSFVGAVMGNG